MYYSDFFIRGYALHGYDPAPGLSGQPRLHAPADPGRDPRLQLAAIGDWVDVYQGSGNYAGTI